QPRAPGGRDRAHAGRDRQGGRRGRSPARREIQAPRAAQPTQGHGSRQGSPGGGGPGQGGRGASGGVRQAARGDAREGAPARPGLGGPTPRRQDHPGRSAPLRTAAPEDNVKPPHTAIFLGGVICGRVASRAAPYAQSPAAPISIDGEDKPWNHGIPIATRQAARELFLEGNRLFYIPLYTRAAEKYLAALDQWKHPAFYFNLALTQLSLGQQAEAHDNLQRAMQQGEEPL